MKKVCSEDSCYKMVDYEDDVVFGMDGTPYERSLKCWDCRTDADRKAIKQKRKLVARQQRKLKS